MSSRPNAQTSLMTATSSSSPAPAPAAAGQTPSAIAKERRATRKAAAACLARQRHKSFVNSLQDNGSELSMRVDALRARRGNLQAYCAGHMLTLFEEELAAERVAQLRGWLKDSFILEPLPAAPLPTAPQVRSAPLSRAWEVAAGDRRPRRAPRHSCARAHAAASRLSRS